MSDEQTNPIREAIAEAIQDNEVILFMKGTPEQPMCGFSARTVAALQTLDARFAAVDILPDPRIRQELSAISQWPTIPQLFVRGELVGGADIVTEMFETGELAEPARHRAGRGAASRCRSRIASADAPRRRRVVSRRACARSRSSPTPRTTPPRELIAAAGVREVSLYVSDSTGSRRENEIDDYGTSTPACAMSRRCRRPRSPRSGTSSTPTGRCSPPATTCSRSTSRAASPGPSARPARQGADRRAS